MKNSNYARKLELCDALEITLQPAGWRYCPPGSSWTQVVVIGELVAGAPATVVHQKRCPKFPMHVGAPLIEGCLTRVERLENGGRCVTVGDRGWLLVPCEQPQSAERRSAA